jgi:hypothetical protein
MPTDEKEAVVMAAGSRRGRARLAKVVAAVGLVAMVVGLGATFALNRSVSVAPAGGSMSGMAATTENDEPAFTGYVRHADYTAVVDVLPAKVGKNTIAVTVVDAHGGTPNIVSWSAQVSPPGARASVPVGISEFAAGVATIYPSFPTGGDWTFAITIQTADGKASTFTQVVPVNGNS